MSVSEPVRFRGLWICKKYYADDDLARATPYETVEAENLLLTAGANALFSRLYATSVTAFSSANAYLCVGTGTTAAAIGQTDLQGGTKTRKIVDGTPTQSTNTITYVSTFTTADGNHAWEEAGLANHTSAGVLLNRVVQSFGTKTVSFQWVLTAILSLS